MTTFAEGPVDTVSVRGVLRVRPMTFVWRKVTMRLRFSSASSANSDVGANMATNKNAVPNNFFMCLLVLSIKRWG